MDEELDTLSKEELAKALKEGVFVEANGEWVRSIGTLSLIWHPTLKHYAFVFGTSPANAAFVLLIDKGVTWRL